MKRRLRAELVAVLTVLLLAGCASDPGSGSAFGPLPTEVPTAAAGGHGPSCTVAAAGDIAGWDDYRTGAASTARLISRHDPDRVIALGDEAYEYGTIKSFLKYYDPTWGAFKNKTLALPGNHDYEETSAERPGDGFGSYFGRAAQQNRGVDLCGGWRVLLVNQYAPDGIAAGAAFIAREAAEHPNNMLIAAWHAPRFSSGAEHGDDRTVQPLWAAAITARVRIVLNGHEHDYERFAQVGPSGTQQFVSGLGGHHIRAVGKSAALNSQVRFTGTPAVLFLTLHDGGYSWEERTVTGKMVDQGEIDIQPLK